MLLKELHQERSITFSLKIIFDIEIADVRESAENLEGTSPDELPRAIIAQEIELPDLEIPLDPGIAHLVLAHVSGIGDALVQVVIAVNASSHFIHHFARRSYNR